MDRKREIQCDTNNRLSLWDYLYSICHNFSLSWIVRGDFDVILSEKEKIGSLFIYP